MENVKISGTGMESEDSEARFGRIEDKGRLIVYGDGIQLVRTGLGAGKVIKGLIETLGFYV